MTPRRGTLARLVVTLATTIAILPSHAGRPLTTEDASVLEEKRCQVESWIDGARGATLGWLVPACNFGGGIEWQAGFAREWADGDHRFADSYAQAKLLWPAKSQNWAAGAVIGVARHGNAFASLPVTYAGEGFAVHLAPGWFRHREDRRDLATWGVAIEVPGSAGITWLAETFGENRDRSFVRLGGRWSVTPDFDVDLSVVTRPGGAREERFVSLGVFWQSPRFLP